MGGVACDPEFIWQRPEPKALLVTDRQIMFDLMIELKVPNCQEWRTIEGVEVANGEVQL